eukprot:CAMPEP_0175580906 /NCGR_PEP_ID=MMETSP0096-20121207/47349_1 /TAXON_ID=311494 /ORGANISM="Alexandrium monilatum, Strain CCMP3105" /LENGTH=60 /DNA_ID=CAMNT_0016884535 /DNA_START=71 /DNA_END=249 /DNA_ORIENTATION=+
MATRRPVLCLLATAAAMVWSFGPAAAPAFAGARPASSRPPRSSAASRRASEFYEIFVTNP